MAKKRRPIRPAAPDLSPFPAAAGLPQRGPAPVHTPSARQGGAQKKQNLHVPNRPRGRISSVAVGSAAARSCAIQSKAAYGAPRKNASKKNSPRSNAQKLERAWHGLLLGFAASVCLLLVLARVIFPAAVNVSGGDTHQDYTTSSLSLDRGETGQAVRPSDDQMVNDEKSDTTPSAEPTPTEPIENVGGMLPNKEKEAIHVSYAEKNSSTASLHNKIKSSSAILVDVSSGTVTASLNETQKIYPASLTKVMTLITAYDLINDIETETFTMTYEILNPLIGSGNSLAGFEVGECARLVDYMYGMIMPSGADAAEAIAVYCAGSVEAFAEKMNEKAVAMGLTGSHFTNVVGEHDKNHYSTVQDMALILEYAYQVDELVPILNTYTYTTPATPEHPQGLYFESNLQQRMHGDESGTCEVKGGKTGYTPEAGHCVMAYAVANQTGKAYIFVSADGKALYDPIWDCINTLADYAK